MWRVKLEANSNVRLQIPHTCGLCFSRWCLLSFWIVCLTILHSLHLNDRMTAGFLSTYVLVISDPFLVLTLISRGCTTGGGSIDGCNWSVGASSVPAGFILSSSVDFFSSSVSISSAIVLSTLCRSNWIGWGAISSGLFATPIGIRRALSSSSSRVSSNESPRLSNVFAASRSPTVLVAAGIWRSALGTSEWLTTKSGSVMSACTGSDEAADVDGVANGVSMVTSPSIVVVFRESFVLFADILDADSALLGW